MIRIVSLDSHLSFLECFKLALLQSPGLSVVGEATEARRALALVETLKPDLLLSELFVRDTDAASIARELRRRKSSTPLMVLSAHANPAFASEAFRAGAAGYALKEQPLSQILQAIKKVTAGGRYLAPTLGAAPDVAKKPLLGGEDRRGLLARLTRREHEVFCRILDGLRSREIAVALSISLKTVETHRAHINEKVGVHSPVELIRAAATQGLLINARSALQQKPVAATAAA